MVVKAFVGPFLATFLIAMFVLIMQFFWLYIDDLVGKGLEVSTVLQLILYVAASVVPLALPIALLLSSIMTFGNMGETFEIVAIKSAGIPLLRFIRPLFFVTCGIGCVAFLFSNNIIPVAQLKLATIKYNIIVSKPSFDIKEGVFYDKIEGFVIKLGKKDKDDSTIHDIVIYEKDYNLQDNVILAKHGVMRVTPDKKFLEFILKEGNRYTERGMRGTTGTEYIRLGFSEYKKVFDLKSFSLNNTNDSAFRSEPKMLSVRQLNATLKELGDAGKITGNRIKAEIVPYVPLFRYASDSLWGKALPSAAQRKAPLIPESLKTAVYDRTLSQLSLARNGLENILSENQRKQQSINLHKIEWHRKFTLSVACLVLFLVGAPLGTIIRKGGLGAPLVFAIIFFVFFHLINTFGEKMAGEGITNVFTGMWLSTFCLLPVGIFLTYKAMNDSVLFNTEVYFNFFSSIKKIFDFKKNTVLSTDK